MRSTLNAAIADRRAGIATAEIEKRVAAVASLPDEVETLDALSKLVADAAKVQLSSDDATGLANAVRTKADAITGPIIDAAINQARAQPATLDGLAAVTRIEHQIDTLIARLGPGLGADRAREKAAQLHEIADSLTGNAAVQNSFAQAMNALTVATGQDAESVVDNAAGRYLDPAQFRGPSAIPAYGEAVAQAIATLEIKSIQFADHSTRSVSGEPTAKEMLLAVKAKFDQINEQMSSTYDQCQRGEFHNDPLKAMQCVSLLATGNGAKYKVRLTRFEKLACDAADSGYGYICDYVLGFDSNSPFTQGLMAQLTGAGSQGTGRFVSGPGGWSFVTLPQ